MTQTNQNNTKPSWRKNPMVWMILFFPTLAVVAGFYTLYLAIESDDGLVTDDYYKQGIGINKTLSRDKNAIDKNISGLMSIDASSGNIQMKLSDSVLIEEIDHLEFSLFHRTIPGFDQTTLLEKVDGTLLYRGQIKPLPSQGGKWRWEVSGQDWRINHKFTTRDESNITHSFP